MTPLLRMDPRCTRQERDTQIGFFHLNNRKINQMQDHALHIDKKIYCRALIQYKNVIVRRAGLLLSQQDFEWR